MTKKKLYDKVQILLEMKSDLRDSDRKLVWEIWESQGMVLGDVITYDNFMRASKADSITRASRMIKQLHPELKGTKNVILVKEKR